MHLQVWAGCRARSQRFLFSLILCDFCTLFVSLSAARCFLSNCFSFQRTRQIWRSIHAGIHVKSLSFLCSFCFTAFFFTIQQFSACSIYAALFKTTALQNPFFLFFLSMFFLQLFSSGRHSFDECNAKEWQTRRLFFSFLLLVISTAKKLQRWEETYIWLSRIQWLR